MKNFVFEYKNGARVIVCELFTNRFILASTGEREKEGGNNCRGTISFLVRSDDKTRTVEWEPEYGPISVNWKDENGDRIDPLIGRASNDWTQMGVHAAGLPELARKKRYEDIFAILEQRL